MTVADTIFAGLLAILGAAVGSYGALLSERIIRRETSVFGRSRCRSCAEPLKASELLPIASYVLLRGRCSHCGARIPQILWQAEVIGALFGVLAYATIPYPEQALVLAIWMWTLLALAVADLRYFRLPDIMVAGSAIAGLLLVILGDTTGWPLSTRLWESCIGALAGAGSFWIVRFVYISLTGREGMGLGDVKLMAAIGLVIGPYDLPLVVLFAALSSLVLSILRSWRKKRPLNRLGRAPFGAALCFSAVCVATLQRVWLLA